MINFQKLIKKIAAAVRLGSANPYFRLTNMLSGFNIEKLIG